MPRVGVRSDGRSWHGHGRSSANRDEVVVVEQRVDQVRRARGVAGSAAFGCGSCGHAASASRQAASSSAVGSPASTVRNAARMNSSSAALPGRLSQPRRRSSPPHRSGQLAVRQRQGLLRHDALGAAIAFQHAGVVEHRQELADGRCANGRSTGCGAARPRRSTGIDGPPQRQVELAGQVQQAVADDLGFHAHRVHPPVEAVLGIGGQRLGRGAGARRRHAIRAAT